MNEIVLFSDDEKRSDPRAKGNDDDRADEKRLEGFLNFIVIILYFIYFLFLFVSTVYLLSSMSGLTFLLDAQNELEEFMRRLKEVDKVLHIGARIPRGILFLSMWTN